MRALLLVVLFLALAVNTWAAGPYLVCDPLSAAENVTSFQVSFDGGAYVTTPPVSNAIKYDLASIAAGAHTVKAKACNAWGCGADSSPFVFSKSVPGVPTNINITAQ